MGLIPVLVVVLMSIGDRLEPIGCFASVAMNGAGVVVLERGSSVFADGFESGDLARWKARGLCP